MNRALRIVLGVLLSLATFAVGGIIIIGIVWLLFFKDNSAPDWFGITWASSICAVITVLLIYGIVKGIIVKKGKTKNQGEKQKNNLACAMQGHNWDGCKCRRCGQVRNEGHVWEAVDCSRCGGTGYLPYVNCGLSYGDPDYGNPDPQGVTCDCSGQKWMQCTICGQEKDI